MPLSLEVDRLLVWSCLITKAVGQTCHYRHDIKQICDMTKAHSNGIRVQGARQITFLLHTLSTKIKVGMMKQSDY